jgi:hypothetical protein
LDVRESSSEAGSCGRMGMQRIERERERERENEN